MGTFLATRSRSSWSARSTLLMIDTNGTTRLGPLPLRNTNLRDAAFVAVSHLNKGTVTVSAEETIKFSDLLKTMDAMKWAGITNVMMRTERSPSTKPATVTNK